VATENSPTPVRLHCAPPVAIESADRRLPDVDGLLDQADAYSRFELSALSAWCATNAGVAARVRTHPRIEQMGSSLHAKLLWSDHRVEFARTLVERQASDALLSALGLARLPLDLAAEVTTALPSTMGESSLTWLIHLLSQCSRRSTVPAASLAHLAELCAEARHPLLGVVEQLSDPTDVFSEWRTLLNDDEAFLDASLWRDAHRLSRRLHRPEQLEELRKTAVRDMRALEAQAAEVPLADVARCIGISPLHDDEIADPRKLLFGRALARFLLEEDPLGRGKRWLGGNLHQLTVLFAFLHMRFPQEAARVAQSVGSTGTHPLNHVVDQFDRFGRPGLIGSMLADAGWAVSRSPGLLHPLVSVGEDLRSAGHLVDVGLAHDEGQDVANLLTELASLERSLEHFVFETDDEDDDGLTGLWAVGPEGAYRTVERYDGDGVDRETDVLAGFLNAILQTTGATTRLHRVEGWALHIPDLQESYGRWEESFAALRPEQAERLCASGLASFSSQA